MRAIAANSIPIKINVISHFQKCTTLMRSISSCIHTLNNVIYIVTVDKKKHGLIVIFISLSMELITRLYFDKNQGRYH